MMSGAKQRVPKRRFKEFLNAGDWEQRKLGDLAEIVRGASPRPISDPKWFDNDSSVGWLRIADVTAQDGRIRYLEQKISELGQEKTRVIKTPHLLLSIAATVGKPVINYVPTGVHDGFLIFLNPKFNILYTFWWLEMFREKWNKYGQPGSQVNLNSDLVKNQVINIPNEKEQEKISLFLESLDKIITLHQRKLEKLQATKKALLQEMFPEEGQDKPKRRFKGFTDAWEQRKLLTVLNKIVDYRGRTPKKLGLDWSATGHLALSALNVKMGYVDKTVDAHYGDDHLYSVWMKDNDLYEGQVLFTTEAPMGNVAQVPDDNKYILSQRTIAFVPDRSVISDNFLAVVLSASKCQKNLINRASGGTAKGVSQKTLSEIFLDIPQSLSEQDKVSELIKKLSEIITLHQRKLDKLKNLKQAYLNEMFV